MIHVRFEDHEVLFDDPIPVQVSKGTNMNGVVEMPQEIFDRYHATFRAMMNVKAEIDPYVAIASKRVSKRKPSPKRKG